MVEASEPARLEAEDPGPTDAPRGDGVAPPRQARSRETLDRLLTAAESLLRDRSLEEIPVRAVCERAGYTVGAFYARFDDKDALLERLRRRTVDRFASTVETQLEGPRWSRPETERSLAEVMSALLAFHREERGMLRTLLRRAGEDARARRTLERMDEEVARRLDDRLPRARSSWAHPDPERGIRGAASLVLGAIRSAEVHPGPDALAGDLEDRQRAALLARAFVGAAGMGSIGGGLFR